MITPQQFGPFITTVSTILGEAYSSAPSIAKQFATEIPLENASTWEAGWTGKLPKMRVWTGPRVAFEPAPQTYSVTPKPYEATLVIDRFHLDDDKFGIYYRMFADMGQQAALWPDFELRDLIEASGAWSSTTAQAGLDGLPFFSTAHPIDFYNQGASGPGTYINDFTGGGQNVNYSKTGGGNTTISVGGAFSPTAFKTLVEYQGQLKGEDNEVLDVTPSHLMHAWLLKAEVDLVLKSQFFAPPAWGTITGQVGAGDNILKRYGVEPLLNPRLKNAATWYSLDLTKAVKPFLWILREPVRLVPRTSEDDPIVFDIHAYVWGEWARAAPAWNYSWLAARSGP